MASAIIHISVANEINKKLKMNNDLLLIGSIAPDLAKLIGKTKDKGHFLFGDKGTPHIDKFLLKYRIDNPFNMGYYIHLYTDLYWFRDLLPKHYKNKKLVFKNGKELDIPFEKRLEAIYKDYTSLNNILIKKYNIDTSFLNKEYKIDTEISELDFTKLNLLTKETNKLINESVTYPLEIFDELEIVEFINSCVENILKEVENEQFNTSK
ncbi:MAG: hypothetical protein SOZ95_05915 [Bacilli bacterium]|nr:hypothetical protein [Bacilli bacterium]